MKITIEIPNTTVCAFLDYVYYTNTGMGMASRKIDTADIQSGEVIVCDLDNPTEKRWCGVMAIDRTTFLQMCQRVSILKSGICGIKENVPDELMVVYNGINYYPVAYELSFDDKGNARHTAILHDLKANSIMNADLRKVKKEEYL